MNKLLILVMLGMSSAWAQVNSTYKGTVQSNENEPLVGATIYWLSEPTSAVFSENGGQFEIKKIEGLSLLIISMVGMKADTFDVSKLNTPVFVLNNDNELLNEVVVEGSSNFIDKASPQQIEVLTSKSLTKAACCNLSEAFETNATVSVAVNDAVTGAKQLQLLGMNGRYVQTNFENLPNVRGLATTFGLLYTPGTWIQSIDISKGVGSVVNGYESMVGGVNVEYQKPQLSDRLYVNTYVNSNGRVEANINLAHKFNDKLSVGLLSHGSLLKNQIDNNGDTFMDVPTYDQVNLLNRWNYRSDRVHAQWGIRYMNENRLGGQFTEVNNPYTFTNHTQRVEAFSKTGILFPETPYRGMALIVHAAKHDTQNQFGFSPYNGLERSMYANFIYQDIFGNTNHTYKTGISYLYDSFDENYKNNFSSYAFELNRVEHVPGVFFEYTFKPSESTALVVGTRTDFHNLFGVQHSPRLHFKQDFGEKLSVRLSGGRGFRVPNYLAETFGFLVSSRVVEIRDILVPEVTWNFGGSINYELFPNFNLIIDAYRTEFVRRQMYDLRIPGALLVYGSDGGAFVNSLQAEIKWEPVKRLDINLAYRNLNDQQTFQVTGTDKIQVRSPFVAPHTWHFNAGYALPYDKWKWDLTIRYNGKQNIPYASGETQVDTRSPFKEVEGYFIVNAQINRNFRSWEYYLGGENLLNFRQPNPIYGAQNPFSRDFDAGLVYGPIVGRIVYLGTRFKIQ